MHKWYSWWHIERQLKWADLTCVLRNDKESLYTIDNNASSCPQTASLSGVQSPRDSRDQARPLAFLTHDQWSQVDALTWKYVDDATISQSIPRGSLCDVQHTVTAVEVWSWSQRMQLNADKCREMVIDFKKISHNFSPLKVDGNELPVTDCAKILSVKIFCDLKWNNHIVDCIKKANKRLYFIVLLKRARVPLNDIVNFYCTTIRPVLEYCAPVFHHALPAYLTEDIERIQKRALSIISPAKSCLECFDSLGLPTLYDRCNGLCRQWFDSIAINPGHKLYHLLPPRKQSSYNLRLKVI